MRLSLALSVSLGCYRCTSFARVSLTLTLFPARPDFFQSLKYGTRNVAGWRRCHRCIYIFFFFFFFFFFLSQKRLGRTKEKKKKLCQAVRIRLVVRTARAVLAFFF